LKNKKIEMLFLNFNKCIKFKTMTTLKMNPFTKNMNAFSLPEALPTKNLSELREALWLECLKYTPDPELEALDDKLEREYYLECKCEEERDSFEDDEERDSFEDDEDTEVYHFNKLNKTNFPHTAFEKLKNYAKSNMITLVDATSYSQSCHNCNKFFEQEEDSLYGKLYCSEKCEKEVEVYDCPCFYEKISNCRKFDDVVCDMCTNPDKVSLFNSRYNVTNFDEKKINETRKFAKEHYITICKAIYYASHCHGCGNAEIEYGQMYCNEICCDYIEYFNNQCIYGEGCKLCSNYISQEEQDLRHRLDTI
jgi:hypothetical protein